MEALALLEGPPEALLRYTLAGAISPHTRRAYLGDLQHFAGWLLQRGSPPLERAVIVAYRDELVGAFRPRTVNRRLSTVRTLCRELTRRGAFARDPGEGVKGCRMSAESPLPALALSEARLLLATCAADTTPRGPRDLSLIAVAHCTGIRSSELLEVRPTDFAREGELRVLRFRAKGRIDRRTKIRAADWHRILEWRAVLASLRGGEDIEAPLWSGMTGPRKPSPAGAWKVSRASLSASGLAHLLRSRARAAGIECRVSSHVLRRTFVTLALEGGAPLRLAQYAAGHADPRTTEAYDAQRGSIDHHASDYLPPM